MNNTFNQLNDSFLKENTYIFKKYKPIKKIGKGCFGNIYSAIRLKDKNVFAMKTEKLKGNNNKILESEAYYLFILQGFGIPELISFGHTKKYNILIETLLDKSLEDIYIKENIPSNIIDICLIGLQIIDRLEWIHSKDIIYRDVKPDNFLIGIKDPNVIYIIDFGLCKKYRSSKTGKHILPKYSRKFNGNLKFCSPYAIKGKESSRRDDLISLGYMLIFLLKKELPWDNYKGKITISKLFEIIYLKENDGFGKLFKNIPKELVEFFKYTKKLKFEQEPNYSFLRSLLNKIIFNMNYKQLTFSWIKSKDQKLFATSQRKSKRKISPFIRIFNNIEKRKIKTNRIDGLNESDKLVDFNKLSLNNCSNNISISSNKKNKKNFEFKKLSLKNNNKYSKLTLIDLFKNKEFSNNKDKEKKTNKNIKILNIQKFAQTSNNYNKNNNGMAKKRLNTLKILNSSNNIVNIENKIINRSVNKFYSPFPIIINNIIDREYNDLTNMMDYSFNDSKKKNQSEYINYIFNNKTSQSSVNSIKAYISNETEYISPIFKHRIREANYKSKTNKTIYNGNLHKRTQNIANSYNSVNSNNNTIRPKRNNTNIFLINNNVNYITKSFNVL